MSSIRDKKIFQGLDFQIWHIWEERRERWRNEIYIIGDDEALQTMRNSLQGLLDMFQAYGKGTRKYKCNPPTDFDYVSYGQEHGVKIQWLDSLVVRLSSDALDNEPFIIEDFVVTLNVSFHTLRTFIDRIQEQLDSAERYGHGSVAVCGLRFSPDWLGIE